jgi:hypothetical protein
VLIALEGMLCLVSELTVDCQASQLKLEPAHFLSFVTLSQTVNHGHPCIISDIIFIIIIMIIISIIFCMSELVSCAPPMASTPDELEVLEHWLML